MTVEDREEKLMVRAALAAAGPARPDTCLDAEDLAAFLDGRLSSDQRASVMAHLEACPDCYRTWLASAAAIEEETGLDRTEWESRIFVVRGTRIEPARAETMNRAAMGLMRPGPPPVAEVEAQEELHKFVQCPWCDAVGWVPMGTDSTTGCRCSVCDGIFSF